MPLKEYSKKRNLKESKEPSAEKKSSSKKNIYMIHEHHASHLHWDLRLEENGVLKSWAIPKSPEDLKKSGVKRLAVQVEDHPLAYAKFHGVIPEGNYGAGKVEIWDSGTYDILEKNPEAMKIRLRGKKLKGDYVLVKTRFLKKRNGWLFFKIQNPISQRKRNLCFI